MIDGKQDSKKKIINRDIFVNSLKKIKLILFFISFISCLFFGCKEKKIVIEETPPISEQTIEKFTITQTSDGKLKMILEAESAIINDEDQIANLKLPIIKFYNNGEYVSTLVTEKAKINMETYDIEGFGKCTIDNSDNEQLQTTDLMYVASKELIYSNKNIEITKPDQKIYGTSFQSDVKLENIVIKNQRTVFDKS
ncbi:MAG: LPS export ABC transporter periplasmic protein LptC [Endomicrobium sp.]|jgi:LPS export ABC transporter protein LptC|nr:LPS export ABC transporter periplasmic protein LptC [Endomicrobium sp.]